MLSTRIASRIFDALSVLVLALCLLPLVSGIACAATTSTNFTVSVTCTSGTGYSMALDGGSTSNAMTARNMKDTAGDLLSYGLYTTSGDTTIWGDGTGSGAAQPYTVYGQIPANQYVPPSSYSDTINVTVTY